MTDATTSGPSGYRRYTKDGTYWTSRKRGNYFEVVRLRAGTYEEVDSMGAYASAGAAAGTAAELAYQQGRQEAQEDLSAKLHEVLAGMGMGLLTVAAPEVPPEKTGDLPAPETED